MKSFIPRVLAGLGLALLLGGCAAYNTQMDHGRSLAKIQRFFVVSNLNDNHALDHQIVEALKARGREAETGPLTMMPDNTQAIIAFQDRWAWDFGDHLVFLQLAVRDTRSEQSFATVTFSAKIPLREEASVTVSRLVDRLLDKK
jgi:hypothetical protein